MGNGLLLAAHPLSSPSTPLLYGEIRKPFLLLPWNPFWFSRAFPHHHQVTPVYGDEALAQPWQQEELALCTGSYLGSNVVRRPTECGRCHTVQNPFLAHPKVGQLAVTFCIQKDIVQFQIPARWARTTWLMLHPSQYVPLELEFRSPTYNGQPPMVSPFCPT